MQNLFSKATHKMKLGGEFGLAQEIGTQRSDTGKTEERALNGDSENSIRATKSALCRRCDVEWRNLVSEEEGKL